MTAITDGNQPRARSVHPKPVTQKTQNMLSVAYERINRFVDRVTPQKILWASIAVFMLYFSFVAFSRHDNFYSRRLDLGNMDQTVWNVLHGNGFTLTDPMGTTQETRLAVHADFLLILLAPLYLLWSNPGTLIFIQTIAVTLGALPVYWIAHDRLKSKKIALMFSLSYLLYPPLERMMLHDFHAVALSTTLLLFAYWYLIKERYVPFVLFGVLAALGKEQVWLVVGLMGLYIAIRNKRIVLGVLVAVISFFFFYYLFWQAIPAVTPTKQHFALAYLSDFGDRQNSIVKHIITNPVAVVRTALLPDRLFYYFELFVPLGLFSLAAPWFLIFSAPSLLINILSNNTLMRQIDYQYTADIAPFIFISAIEGYGVISMILSRKLSHDLRHHWQKILLTAFMLAALLSNIGWGELPFGIQSRFFYFTSKPPEYKIMQKVEAMAMPSYSVSVTNNIGSHFSERKRLYNFPINANTADLSVAMLGDQYAWPSGDAQKQAVNELLQNPQYVLIAHQNNFYAFLKKGL